MESDCEDGATYEVEVTKTNGDTVDVRLDENFVVVVIEGDPEDSNGGHAGQKSRRILQKQKPTTPAASTSRIEVSIPWSAQYRDAGR